MVTKKQRIAIIDEEERLDTIKMVMGVLYDSDLSFLEMLGVLEICKFHVKEDAEIPCDCKDCKKYREEE